MEIAGLRWKTYPLSCDILRPWALLSIRSDPASLFTPPPPATHRPPIRRQSFYAAHLLSFCFPSSSLDSLSWAFLRISVTLGYSSQKISSMTLLGRIYFAERQSTQERKKTRNQGRNDIGEDGVLDRRLDTIGGDKSLRRLAANYVLYFALGH